MLGAFFLVSEHFLFQRGIFGFVFPRGCVPAMGRYSSSGRRRGPASRAMSRARAEWTDSFLVLWRFPRTGASAPLAETQEVHIRRRVDGPQGAVEIEGSTPGSKSQRWESTTWKMSPAAMYSLARRTLSRNFALGVRARTLLNLPI